MESIKQYCDDIILGTTGFKMFENREVVHFDTDRDVAIAKWVIRCLGNDPSSEAQEVVNQIVQRRMEQKND